MLAFSLTLILLFTLEITQPHTAMQLLIVLPARHPRRLEHRSLMSEAMVSTFPLPIHTHQKHFFSTLLCFHPIPGQTTVTNLVASNGIAASGAQSTIANGLLLTGRCTLYGGLRR